MSKFSHGRRYGFGDSGHGRGLDPEVLRRIPRGLKIALVLIALFILLAGAVILVLVVLVLAKLLAGGTLPGNIQDALDFIQRNLQPLLELWKRLQSLTGK